LGIQGRKVRPRKMEHENCPAKDWPIYKDMEDPRFFFRMYQPPGTYFKSEIVWRCSGCGEIEDA
jgi:hypothetical protein